LGEKLTGYSVSSLSSLETIGSIESVLKAHQQIDCESFNDQQPQNSRSSKRVASSSAKQSKWQQFKSFFTMCVGGRKNRVHPM